MSYTKIPFLTHQMGASNTVWYQQVVKNILSDAAGMNGKRGSTANLQGSLAVSIKSPNSHSLSSDISIYSLEKRSHSWTMRHIQECCLDLGL